MKFAQRTVFKGNFVNPVPGKNRAEFPLRHISVQLITDLITEVVIGPVMDVLGKYQRSTIA